MSLLLRFSPPSSLSSLPRHLSTLPRHFCNVSRQLSTSPRQLSTAPRRTHVHARRHRERRLVPFTPPQLFSVVSSIDSYHEFVPWCTSSKILTHLDSNTIIADLHVGFNFLSDHYSSVVTLQPYTKISVDVPSSSLFDYLITDWHFAPHPQGTILDFDLEFAFRNPLYQRVTDLFFERVAKQMVTAFEQRCQQQFSTLPPTTTNARGRSPDHW